MRQLLFNTLVLAAALTAGTALTAFDPTAQPVFCSATGDICQTVNAKTEYCVTARVVKIGTD